VSHVTPLPTEPEELRELALAAEVYLRIDSARLYGFISGGPVINVERCEETLAVAREHGITYTEADIEHATRGILAAHMREDTHGR
jgi:hypothetical protein